MKSRTGATEVALAGDGNSIIFRNRSGVQIFWPTSDWIKLRNFVEAGIGHLAKNPPKPLSHKENLENVPFVSSEEINKIFDEP
jgi:hypothetical protein